MSDSGESRSVRAYVPGKQVTLAHIIAHPASEMCEKVGLDAVDAVGVLTLTPGETSMIAADIAIKAAGVSIGFLDRFSGTLIVHGSVGEVEQALSVVMSVLVESMEYNGCRITRY